MAHPLDGILVVALEQAVAAPFCTSRLADAGARVIKIERPGGDFARGYDHAVYGESSYFVWLNRGKQSIELDIKQTGDKALLERMIASADIFIQNLAPGAAARAGFDSSQLRARHARLITCDISGYGTEGPYAGARAYDMLVQAESGLAAITGGAEAPARVGVSVCDIAAGMYAHAAILEALIGRSLTGKGEGISVSLFDGMADWMSVPLLQSDYGGEAPGRVGLRHPSIAPYSAFPTRGGGEVVISIQNEREWERFAGQIMGRPEWAVVGDYVDNVSRVANRARLDKVIADEFSKFTTDEMVTKLKVAGIAFGRVNDVDGLSSHPALRRIEVEVGGNRIAIPAPPARRCDTLDQAFALGPVPASGEHGDALRKEFSALQDNGKTGA